MCLYVSIVAPQKMRLSDRTGFVTASLVNQFYVSFALIFLGALVVAEIIAQSLQPGKYGYMFASEELKLKS